MKTTTYTRLISGQILTANVISLNDAQVVYTLNNHPQVHKEYTPLFLKCFTKSENINDILQKTSKAGFEEYGSFNEGEYQHDILTCIKGDYDGEVIDIYYNYQNGAVKKIEYSCQFPNQLNKFIL